MEKTASCARRDMGIRIGNRRISGMVVNSFMGHSGGGYDYAPLNLLPSYRATSALIRDTETTVIAKSATRHAFKGNYSKWAPWKTVKKVRRGFAVGLINSYRLSNDGVDLCSRKIKDAIRKGFKVIPSYFPDLSKGLDTALKEIREAVNIYSKNLGRDLWAIEIDGSCANMEQQSEENEGSLSMILNTLRMVFGGTVILKYGPANSPSFLKYLEDSQLVDIFNGLNSFHHKILCPKEKSPLEKYGKGSYSGEIIYVPALHINMCLRSKLRNPMILGGGISSIDHASVYLDIIRNSSPGANSQSSLGICTVLSTHREEGRLMLKYYAS